MRNPIAFLCDRLIRAVVFYAARTPYFHLEGYMHRYWLLGARSLYRNADNPVKPTAPTSRFYEWLTRRVAIRVHHILRSDGDRHCHDHPCSFVSVILRGGYWETRAFVGVDGNIERTETQWHGAGSVLVRRATDFHRIELPRGESCWTVFIMGPKVQQWGFLTGVGKVGWRQYLGEPIAPQEVA